MSKFSETKIAGILKELETGVAVAELAWKHGVGESAIYQWRAKFGGISVSDMQRLRELKAENERLKKMYARPGDGTTRFCANSLQLRLLQLEGYGQLDHWTSGRLMMCTLARYTCRGVA